MRRDAFIGGAAACALVAAAPLSIRRFRLAVDTLGSSLDPYDDPATDVDRYAWIYGDGLTDGARVPRGALADLPESRDGGRTYRYTLRPVPMHDGSTLRAADVTAALTRLHDAHSPWLTYEPYSLVDDVAIRSANVVDVRLHRASASFVRTFFSPYGRPALPLVRHDAEGRPVGSGPFRFTRRVEDRYLFDAFDRPLRGLAASPSLEVRIVGSPATLGLELAAREIDLVLPIVLNLPGAGHYRVVSRHNGVIVLLFNCRGVLRSAALRRAFVRALDIDELQRTVDPGAPARVTGLLPPGARDDVPLPAPSLDTDRARAVLSAVGEPVTVVYLAESRRYARLALLIAQMLKPVGVEVNIVPHPQASYLTPNGPLRSGRFDAAIFGFPYGDAPDLSADWSCATIPPNGGNFARFCDPAFDADARKNRVRAAMTDLLSAFACIPLARNVESFGIGPDVIGFDAPAPFVPPTITAERWAVRSPS